MSEIDPTKPDAPRKSKRSRKPQKPRTWLTTEEVERFFRVCKDARDAAMFRLMCHRGLRASEIANFEMKDWDPVRRRLYVKRLKGSLDMEYQLKPVEIAALRRWFKIRGNEPGVMFPSRLGGGLTRWPIFRLMKKYCALAKIDPAKAHPHTMKHTAGTGLAEAGADLLDIKDRLGHADIRSTMTYIGNLSTRRDRFAEKTKNWKI